MLYETLDYTVDRFLGSDQARSYSSGNNNNHQWCPRGFVIPDDPLSVDNVYIDQTLSDCAISCINPPNLTFYESNSVQFCLQIALIIGFLCTVTVTAVWYIEGKKSSHMFAITSGTVASVTLLFFAISQSYGRARLCRNNANPIDGSEGLTLCAVEGFFSVFVSLVFVACFTFQSYAICKRVVFGSTDETKKSFQCAAAVLVPLAMCITAFCRENYGQRLERVNACGFRKSYHGDTVATFMVVLVITTLLAGFLCAFLIMCKMITMGCQPEEHGVAARDAARLTGTTMKFFIFYGCYLVSLIMFWLFSSTRARQNIDISILAWGRCALLNYDGQSEQSYLDICGETAERPYNLTELIVGLTFVKIGYCFSFVVVNIESSYKLAKRYARNCFRSGAVLPKIDDKNKGEAGGNIRDAREGGSRRSRGSAVQIPSEILYSDSSGSSLVRKEVQAAAVCTQFFGEHGHGLWPAIPSMVGSSGCSANSVNRSSELLNSNLYGEDNDNNSLGVDPSITFSPSHSQAQIQTEEEEINQLQQQQPQQQQQQQQQQQITSSMHADDAVSLPLPLPSTPLVAVSSRVKTGTRADATGAERTGFAPVTTSVTTDIEAKMITSIDCSNNFSPSPGLIAADSVSRTVGLISPSISNITRLKPFGGVQISVDEV